MVQGYLHVLKKSIIPRDYKLEKFHKGKPKTHTEPISTVIASKPIM